MKEILTTHDKMTSLMIAEITGKRHSNLMRDIRSMEDAWLKIGQRKFALAEYVDQQGKSRPIYTLTKTECLYIATKFNDEARAKVILRWEQLEKRQQQPKSTLDLLKMAVTEIELKDKQIQQLMPRAQLADRIIETPDLMDIGQVAKTLDLPFGRNTFFKKLREMGVLFGVKNEPKQTYIDRGYFKVKRYLIARNSHEDMAVLKVLVTGKGLMWLSKQFQAPIPNHLLITFQ